MTKRRSNGEGCVYKESRSGRWVGKFVIGYNANVKENTKLVEVRPKKKL